MAIAETVAQNGAKLRELNGETITTKDGTVYISKPYRSSSGKKLKTAVAFIPRRSVFDIENEESSSNQFRGFFMLFWISIFIFMVRTYVYSIQSSGRPLNFEFASMFSRDALTLALSDAALVLSTGICVPFARLFAGGWIRYHWTGVIIQHTLQTAILFGAISWTFNRQWPWVQSGYLTLHTLASFFPICHTRSTSLTDDQVMIMKMHSYIATNGTLSIVAKQRDVLEKKLKRETERMGGWDAALASAKVHREELDAKNSSGSSGSGSSTPPALGTPDLPEGGQTAYMDVPAAQALRNRLIKESRNGAIQARGGQESQKKDEGGGKKRGPPEQHPLVDHPDTHISALAQEWTELDRDLVSSGPIYVRWPENITFKNFVVYQLIPTLVYELEYPRTHRIRPLYVFEKTVATFGTFALLYSITETFILPYSGGRGNFLMALLDLALPFMVSYLLLFFIIFECICNGFAELSYFADRGFYEDWWNSTSQDEFSRKWNKPVHNFLLRHVYAPLITSVGFSRTAAMFFTFLLSACAHELVMAVVTKKIRMYLFIMQLLQIPMIVVGRIPAIKRNKLAGNLFFWLGLFMGFPLLCVAYVTY
ncbi:MBOAT, membrane-bound O-acyltransferase family-domain-containing protein [Vararia minispora EC-137]|uniref:MBOAT, membrane-bound O-acyltransferase family-domain-containing protein n=1 Tax=Vararia minispora EC-137 TaxID=1314806 RepID=A0ACB8QQG5_9AGAM|nr:MBOAT, membrane-bound O-acyltransferase family-domain-containing protein [Vararia minispora EC-137]